MKEGVIPVLLRERLEIPGVCGTHYGCCGWSLLIQRYRHQKRKTLEEGGGARY